MSTLESLLSIDSFGYFTTLEIITPDTEKYQDAKKIYSKSWGVFPHFFFCAENKLCI